MLGRTLIFEKHDNSHGCYFQVKKVLCQYQSKYQEIMVFETEDHGRVLYIDGQMMFTSTTRGPYNESMAQIPIHIHKKPSRVLIIGGGDGCVLDSVLKHKSIEKVVLAELDGEVIEATRKYFPELRASFTDPRVCIKVGDGAAYVKNTKDRFDVCIIDSTDPYHDDDPKSVATPLAQPEFYQDLKIVLGDQGIGIQILGHHYFYKKVFRLLLKRLRLLWNFVDLALVPVPFYISGPWSLGVFSQGRFDARQPRDCEIESFEFYNTEVHKASFVYPNDVKQIIQSL
jgi:spermidine synthase